MKKQAGIKAKLMIVMSLLVAGTVFGTWFLISTFLERFYSHNKQTYLANSYIAIDRAGTENTLESEEFSIEFEKICSTGNLDIMIISAEREVILSYSPNEKQFQKQFLEMLFGVSDFEEQTIAVTDYYEIRRQNDARTNAEYLTLMGSLKNGDYIYMKTPLESIHESAAVTSRFFLLIGCLSIVICVVIIFFVAKSISRPILELTAISKKMCNLDFAAKYTLKQHSSRELETLGSNMNELSETLQTTISKLKAANNELMKDIAQKEKIDQMRKEFLSNVSHELKTPLALISGYAEGLKECVNDSEESREFYCDVIIDETDKMSRMVKELLTLNQLEFGNECVEMERFDITELIEGVLSANMLLAEAADVKLQFLQSDSVFVWGDAFKVEEVITNYLSNAIHYAAGARSVNVFYAQRSKVLRVCVYNSGEIIPEEEMDKIWDKFYKVDKARTREYGGSGIGLSIVKAIMDSFHRDCGVYNVKDGVVFWMELECDN